jgi:hypothetical protein
MAPPAASATAPPPDATSPPPDPTYGDVHDPSLWQTFDVASLAAGPDIGAAFDGRFLYLVPLGGGVVPRYDTRAPFDAASSWTTFDTKSVGPAVGFRGAAFDGRYVYFVPSGGQAAQSGVVVRYDTRASFADGAAWSRFDVAGADARVTGFSGATFDGRYVYLSPYGTDQSPGGAAARLDTFADFSAASSWTTFDTSVLGDAAKGFIGAMFDGRYVYYSPYGYAYGQYGHMVTRYDTQGSFSDASAWSTFDTTAANGRAVGLFGATFDGRYAYFVPYDGDGSWGHALARYDTSAPFASTSSWSFFDTGTLGIGPMGQVFDGRYVWLVPNATPADEPSGGDGIVARIDTLARFDDKAAWTTFDTRSLDPNASWFIGGAFDGEHVYLVPCGHTVAVRFDARKTPSMPGAYHGSFW